MLVRHFPKILGILHRTPPSLVTRRAREYSTLGIRSSIPPLLAYPPWFRDQIFRNPPKVTFVYKMTILRMCHETVLVVGFMCYINFVLSNVTDWLNRAELHKSKKSERKQSRERIFSCLPATAALADEEACARAAALLRENRHPG